MFCSSPFRVCLAIAYDSHEIVVLSRASVFHKRDPLRVNPKRLEVEMLS